MRHFSFKPSFTWPLFIAAGLACLTANFRPFDEPMPMISAGSVRRTFRQTQYFGWPARAVVWDWRGEGTAPWMMRDNRPNPPDWVQERWLARPVAMAFNLAFFLNVCVAIHVLYLIARWGNSTRRMLLFTLVSAVGLALLVGVKSVEIDQQDWIRSRSF